MQFIIGGLQKTSMLDYPDKISAIVFTQGCNFRCGYCHNPSLLEMKNNSIISVDSIFEFLNKRKGKLDAVVITGGEPTLQKDLKAFIYNVKSMGFLVKLDTNGCNNNILSDLINEKLID
ncbi:MAG: anaerobic ribonucleoside-triphosphate reductase activating protein, partial [Candidatus Gastranaerophilales bacterium]|nr:anaerobic ribonucleoside-triphosphate reductase activating protein [Candidatus Gastranaerophilales bacterium]